MISRALRGYAQVVAVPLLALALGCAKDPAPKAGGGKGPVPVLVAKAEQADVPVELRAVGGAESIQSAPLRAQVGGTVSRVRFREGDRVAVGQALFEIDRRPLEATLRQLQANLASDLAKIRSAEAVARNAEAQAQRYRGLVEKEYVTREQYDQLKTNADEAQAAVLVARAAADATRASIENARIELGHTVIRSPISGQAGSLLIKQGDLVKANDTNPMVVINQLDPILVRFTVPEAHLPDVQRYRRVGTLRVRVTPPGAAQAKEGRLVFVDNAVDAATATIALKAQFDNADHALWPGQFLDVTLALYTREAAVVVPSQAIQTGQQGTYVYVVDAGGTASVRPVEAGISAGQGTVVEKGVVAGETVVVDGQLRLTPGAKVVVKEGLGGGRGGRPAGPPSRAAPAGAPAKPSAAAGPRPAESVARGVAP